MVTGSVRSVVDHGVGAAAADVLRKRLVARGGQAVGQVHPAGQGSRRILGQGSHQALPSGVHGQTNGNRRLRGGAPRPVLLRSRDAGDLYVDAVRPDQMETFADDWSPEA